MPDNEVLPLQSGPPLLTEQKEVDMANKKKARNAAVGAGIGVGAGIATKFAIGGIGIVLMGTGVGVGLGAMILGGAVLGGLAGAAATKSSE